MKTLFDHIIATNTETYINEQVDENMIDYINDDWDDEFDDIFEAYEETGRGQAENQAISEVIKAGNQDLNPDNKLDIDEYCELFDMLAAHWNLETS